MTVEPQIGRASGFMYSITEVRRLLSCDGVEPSGRAIAAFGDQLGAVPYGDGSTNLLFQSAAIDRLKRGKAQLLHLKAALADYNRERKARGQANARARGRRRAAQRAEARK